MRGSGRASERTREGERGESREFNRLDHDSEGRARETRTHHTHTRTRKQVPAPLFRLVEAWLREEFKQQQAERKAGGFDKDKDLAPAGKAERTMNTGFSRGSGARADVDTNIHRNTDTRARTHTQASRLAAMRAQTHTTTLSHSLTRPHPASLASVTPQSSP